MYNNIIPQLTSGTISSVMLLILLFLISNNVIMSVKKTQSYVAVVVMTILITIAEMATVIFDAAGPGYRIPNIIANIIGFSLSAFITVVLSILYDESLNSRDKLIFVPGIINCLLFLISPLTGTMFSVSEDNVYSRGPFYLIYVICCAYGLILLFYANFKHSRDYDRWGKIYLFFLCLICTCGTALQVIFPVIHSSWLSVALLLIMYYIFQRELQFKYDSVTGLLSRQAFDRRLEHWAAKNQAAVIMLDLDKFKAVNDNYGHREGDRVLKRVGQIINESFKELGQSYRIGGDEFCVLSLKTDLPQIKAAIKEFNDKIAKERSENKKMPMVSIGYSIYKNKNGHKIQDAIDAADVNMYYNKNLISKQSGL